MSDLQGALDAVIRAFALDPRDEGLLSEIERLRPAAGAWSSLRGVIESAVRPETGLLPEESVRLNLRGAQWYAESIGDPAAAEARVRAALAADPESVEALTMLEGLQRQPGREADLVGDAAAARGGRVRRRRPQGDAARGRDAGRGRARRPRPRGGARRGDPRGRRRRHRRPSTSSRGCAGAGSLGRPGRAARVGALAWPTTRRRRCGCAARSRVSTRAARRRGAGGRRVARGARLRPVGPRGARRPGVALRARQRWRDLEDALRGRLDVAVSVEERVATRLRLADIAEQRLHSAESAVEYLREVVDEVPEHAAAGAGSSASTPRSRAGATSPTCSSVGSTTRSRWATAPPSSRPWCASASCTSSG